MFYHVWSKVLKGTPLPALFIKNIYTNIEFWLTFSLRYDDEIIYLVKKFYFESVSEIKVNKQTPLLSSWKLPDLKCKAC